MGIPTVRRKVKSYLSETLRSLIDKLSPEEKLDCVIIVYVGEVRPHDASAQGRKNCWEKVWRVFLFLSPQTDVDYVHSVVAGLEKEWVHAFPSVQKGNPQQCERTNLVLKRVLIPFFLPKFVCTLQTSLCHTVHTQMRPTCLSMVYLSYLVSKELLPTPPISRATECWMFS